MSTLLSETQIELDLLETLSIPNLPYPWNPLCADCEEYLSVKEADFFRVNGEDSSEFHEPSQLFFSHLEQLWSTVRLQESLRDQFADVVPHDLLQKITKVVETVTAQYESLAEQMVKTVSLIFPQWSEDDLQVLARPLAYVMREGNTENEGIFLPNLSWEQLSEIEQARLCLQVSYYAISQLYSEKG